MKHLNCRFVRKEHVFIIKAGDVNTLLLGIVAFTKKGFVDIKYGVYSVGTTGLVVFVGVDLNYAEADLIRCKLKMENVDCRIEIR